jgi:hypothetical protein
MAWSGGTYRKGNYSTNGWTGDASLGIGIEAGRHDTQDDDFMNGINQCLNKDGSNAATGNLNLGGNILTNIAAGSAAAPALCVGADVNTGVFGPAADTWAVSTNGSEKLRIDSTGNVGIGTNAPAELLHLKSSAPRIRLEDTDGGGAIASISGNSTGGSLTLQADLNDVAAGSNIDFVVDGASRMILDGTGRLAVGGSVTNGRVDVAALTSGITMSLRGRASDNLGILLWTENAGTEIGRIESDTTYLRMQKAGANPIIFTNNATERARFSATDGHFCVGTTNDAPASNNVTGAVVRTDGLIEASRAGTGGGGVGLRVNRRTDDGTMVEFIRGVTTVGSISVASGTVSYNAFSGSHWSQLEDGSRPEILIGTVLESIGEMCEWPNEVEEVLPKVKISDTVASPAVYGVFSAWDNCWDETNDLYVTSLGAFVCRVGAGVTVAIGDLLESNGDGTARVQVETEIKSSTIGKVTSTHRSHEGVDGSYCVPTVLYCG